jgi:hypothetical protein
LDLTIDTTAPAAPTGLALDPASDSGVPGDDLTNVTHPTVHGTAEAGSAVQLFADGILAGSTTAGAGGAWSITPAAALSQGAHQLTATATDVVGNTSLSSAALVVTIDTTPPAAPTGLALDPASDSGVPGDDITNIAAPTITGQAEPGSTVEVFDGSDPLGTTVASTAGAWAFAVDPASPLADGVHHLTATANDVAGNPGPASAEVDVTIDTTVPAAPTGLGLAAASDSGVVGDGITNVTRPTLTGTAEAGSTVQLFDGSTLLGSATAGGTGAWSIPITTALTEGVHHVTATATDAAGNTGPASTAFVLTIDTTPPAAPAALTLARGSDSGVKGDDLTNVARPTITGTAEAGSNVQLYDGSTLLGSATADGTGAWSIQSTVALSDGTHRLTATATDAVGNTGFASASLFLSIDTVPPAPPTMPRLGAGSAAAISGTQSQTNLTTPTLVGTAEPHSTVSLFDGAALLGSTTADFAGGWSFTTPPLVPGLHRITAVAGDQAGNVSGHSPVLTLAVGSTSPSANPLHDVTGQLTVHGTKPRRIRPPHGKHPHGRRAAKGLFAVVTIRNTSRSAILGPLFLRLDRVSGLKSVTHTGTHHKPAAGPSFFVPVAVAGNVLLPGQGVAVTVKFPRSWKAPFRYESRVLAGVG